MLPSISATTSRIAPAAAGSAAASFWRTAAEARSTSLSRCWRGRSRRVPTCTASTSSPTERSTSVRNAALENRAPGVLRDRTHHVAVAALDQHVGHCLAQRLRCAIASRCCWLCVDGGRHQIAVVEPRRMAQHRLRHADVVVGGESADHAGRRVGTRASRLESLARAFFSIVAASRCDHVVEQRDVVFGVVVGARDEQIGDAPQRGRALLLRLGGERVLDLVDQAR